MSISPIITFKAGICDFDAPNVRPKATPGYVYLFQEDDFIQFCWRPRTAPMSSPDLKLLMLPGDPRFVPYKDAEKSKDSTTSSPTNGRIFVLKFQSSNDRHFFWLQAKTQHAGGDASWFSPRDLKIGDIVDRLIQGSDVDAEEEIANVTNDRGGAGDEDAEMEDVAPEGHGSAGAGASSSENRNEGAGPSSGGGGSHSADMPADATTAVQNFLRSLQGSQDVSSRHNAQQQDHFTTLPDLLAPATTIPVIDSAPQSVIDNLLGHIPPALLLLGQQAESDTATTDPNSETIQAAIAAMNMGQKKEILRQVLRSAQFTQSLASLTGAIHEGGLPTIAEALHVPVENGGLIPNGGVPLGGGAAMAAFASGVKKSASQARPDENQGDRMDTK